MLASEDAANQMEMLTQQFYHNLDLADLYYVYHGIHSFIEQPFTSFMPEALLNMARYVVLRTLRDTPTGISRVYPIQSYFLQLVTVNPSIVATIVEPLNKDTFWTSLAFCPL